MSPQTHEDDNTKLISMLMKQGNVFWRNSNNEPCCESRIFVSESDPCSVRMIIMLRKLRGDSLRDFPNPLIVQWHWGRSPDLMFSSGLFVWLSACPNITDKDNEIYVMPTESLFWVQGKFRGSPGVGKPNYVENNFKKAQIYQLNVIPLTGLLQHKMLIGRTPEYRET